MNLLCKFHWDCGRQGDVEGVFVATESDLNKAHNQEVYFGEILGKHSEVYGTLEKKDIEIISRDQDFIKKLTETFCSENISGYNPLDYLKESDNEEEE